MPQAKRIPAHGDVPYQYIIIPTHFKEDRWVRMSEIRPSNRMVVHHAVAYIRDPESNWLRARRSACLSAPAIFRPKLAEGCHVDHQRYIAGLCARQLARSMAGGFAKLVPAGSDIVLQMHYTTHGHATEDRTSIGLVFSKEPPRKRVLTLQLTNDRFLIPPGDPDHRVEVHGTLPNDALLLSFFPHMHLRGKTFEYNMIEPGGRVADPVAHSPLRFLLATQLSLGAADSS